MEILQMRLGMNKNNISYLCFQSQSFAPILLGIKCVTWTDINSGKIKLQITEPFLYLVQETLADHDINNISHKNRGALILSPLYVSAKDIWY